MGRNKLEELLIELLSDEQKEELTQATRRVEEAKGIIEYNRAQRALRITRAELGLQREKIDPSEKWEEKPECKIQYTEVQKEAMEDVKKKIQKNKGSAKSTQRKQAE